MQRIFVLLLFAILHAPAFGSGGIPADKLPIAQLHINKASTDIHRSLRYMRVDPATAVTASVISQMHPLRHASTQFGTAGQTAIVGLRVRNADAGPGSWILSTGRGAVTSLQIYRLENGRPRQIFTNTDRQSLGNALLDYQAIAIPVSLATGEEATFLIRFNDTITMWMPVSVQPYGPFFRERRANIAMTSAVVVGSLVLVFLTVLVFAVTGRREYIWLGAAETAFAFNTLYAEGYSTIFLLYRYPEIGAVFGEFTRTLFGMLMIQFGRVLLASPERYRRLDRLLQLFLWMGAIVLALASARYVTQIVPDTLLRTFGWLFVAASALILPILGLHAVRRSAVNVPLLIGWVVMAIYIGYMTLAISGVLPSLEVHWHWLGPVGLFECLMATLTLVLHLRQLYSGKIEADRTARDALLAKLAFSEETARLADEKARAILDVQSRDRLLVGSAHDTRHVLHALNSAVHFGKTTGQRFEASPELFALIQSSARHLEDIIASSISVGNHDGRFLALGIVDIGQMLGELCTIYEPIAQGNGITLSITGDQQLVCLADEALLARLTSNLLNNALKFTDRGMLTLAYESDDGLLRLTVADTGSGMSDQQRDWLNDNSGTTATPPDCLAIGTGWRAVREIVALMHGTYIIESGQRGTRVQIILPNPVNGQPAPASLAELRAAAPWLRFCDITELDSLAPCPGNRPVTIVADRADATSRQRTATVSSLLLVGPLCREMLAHPYVEELASRPLARAISTN